MHYGALDIFKNLCLGAHYCARSVNPNRILDAGPNEVAIAMMVELGQRAAKLSRRWEEQTESRPKCWLISSSVCVCELFLARRSHFTRALEEFVLHLNLRSCVYYFTTRYNERGAVRRLEYDHESNDIS